MTKIAITTDDGETINSHFGQAQYFQVITLDDDRAPAASEMRAKASHQHGPDHGHDEPGATHPGQAMVESIRDCQVLITGGMGEPALNRARAVGLDVILTGEKQIGKALEAYQKGQLASDDRRIHHH
jgi:predicted Fe-Mo cluster-binding NifX family protein